MARRPAHRRELRGQSVPALAVVAPGSSEAGRCGRRRPSGGGYWGCGVFPSDLHGAAARSADPSPAAPSAGGGGRGGAREGAGLGVGGAMEGAGRGRGDGWAGRAPDLQRDLSKVWFIHQKGRKRDGFPGVQENCSWKEMPSGGLGASPRRPPPAPSC